MRESELYQDGFVPKTEEELNQLTPANLFRYRCKEAIIKTMTPYEQTNNLGCKSEACKNLISLANQIAGNTTLMGIALSYGYSGDFSNIIYDEIDNALHSYCGISIYDVWDYNEKHNIFDFNHSLELYINSNRLMQALNTLSKK